MIMTATKAVAARAAAATTAQLLLSGCLLLNHSRLPECVEGKLHRLVICGSLWARTVVVSCPGCL